MLQSDWLVFVLVTRLQIEMYLTQRRAQHLYATCSWPEMCCKTTSVDLPLLIIKSCPSIPTEDLSSSIINSTELTGRTCVSYDCNREWQCYDQSVNESSTLESQICSQILRGFSRTNVNGRYLSKFVPLSVLPSPRYSYVHRHPDDHTMLEVLNRC